MSLSLNWVKVAAENRHNSVFRGEKRHLVDKCKKALSALKEDPFKSMNLLYFESFAE